MNLDRHDLLHTVSGEYISDTRRITGKMLLTIGSMIFVGSFILQVFHILGATTLGFSNWRPVLFSYLAWAFCLCVARVIVYGEQGKKSLFVLPATLFVASMVVFPLAFAVLVAFSDWNLASLNGRTFNDLDNVWQMFADTYYWNALSNMLLYTLAIIVEYTIAFGLALLLNQDIAVRKLWRVVFLVPLMLSPVALSWMIGKSMLETRFGPIAKLFKYLGLEQPSFFATPGMAKMTIMVLDAWTFIPFMMIMILAGLQAMSREVLEAAEVDGATGWQRFWSITFPLMLPVSVTAIMIRIIFKLKLADIIITLTAGGPGGATDSVTSFIFREYRDRSNVGYGTLLALFYLVLITCFMSLLLKLSSRLVRRYLGTN
jgi:multiple sugar transport system permease protein